MVLGRRKGVRGERDVADKLKTWWNRYEPSAEFIRTPLSGGWHQNSKAAAHFRVSGDLMTTSATFPFCVEVKWREGWSIDALLDGKSCAAWPFWLQACAAAKRQHEVPMMWLRKNRVKGTAKPFPWLVWVPAAYAKLRNLINPDVQWSADQLLVGGVRYGVLPVAYHYERFLSMSPTTMKAEPQRAAGE